MKLTTLVAFILLLVPHLSAQDRILSFRTGDSMQRTPRDVEAVSGEQLTVTLTNGGTLPAEALGHNWVLLKPGTNIASFVAAALMARDTGYIPSQFQAQITANTSILGPGRSQTIRFVAPAPGTYTHICSFPGHSSSEIGTMVIKAAAAGTPTIRTQPLSQTVNTGNTATFNVAVDSPTSLSYQWKKDNAPIPGATNATLVVGNVRLSDAGRYSVDATNAIGSVTSDPVTLTVNLVVTSKITNVSVRTALDAGQSLIVGVSVTGGAKPILFRGIGPGLAAFGVSDVMRDPRLTLFQGSTQIDGNDDWGGSATLLAAFNTVGAFALQPTSFDAALVRSITGSSTAIIGGGTAGVVLVEAYDTGAGNTPRLVNISARNRVGTGANILIAGFTLSGSSPKLILIRAIGPALAPFGVRDFLVDPKLEVYSGAAKINENDNWATSLSATFAQVGAFALTNGSRDAALVLSLPPGGYTVQVSGADGGTGEALVELYEVDP